MFSGCISGERNFKYDNVMVKYTIFGGSFSENQYETEYLLKNTYVSITKRYQNKTISYHSNTTINEEKYREIGKKVVDSSIYDMLDEYRGSQTNFMEKPATAVITVEIDDKIKKITIKPYEEEYAPGNIQKVLFELKRITQYIQR